MKVYDYAIIGAGAAGLQLALALKADPLFSTKSILILDKDKKSTQDKTWCFWEKGDGKWEEIIRKSWTNTTFISHDKNLNLNLNGYSYKMVHSLDFYAYAKKQLEDADHMTWVNEEVEAISCQDLVTIAGSTNTYQAYHIFDSRISKDFGNQNDKHIRLLQHFKGLEIECKDDAFDDSSFTMMDFRVKWPETTSFMYVLPENKRKALIEYTFFSPNLAIEDDYDRMLENYIEDILRIKDYKIKHVERGIIPMSNYPFHQHHTDQITKIGTAGGWVKPSTGYSFKNTERYIEKMIANIKSGRRPSHKLMSKKFHFYDSVFLNVLFHQNYLGETLFESMYAKNSIDSIFRFLDNQTSLSEDLRIINSFQKWPFIKAAYRYLI